MSEDEEDGPDVSLDEAPAAEGPLARGAAVIKSFWRQAPTGPGVYRMLNEAGEVLYVGKARSIKKRVLSYTAPHRLSTRIALMVSQTQSMMFVSVTTEAEALLLEANLIKQLKPRFNVLLKDDKSFPYILLTGDHEAPRLIKHRGARQAKGDYYGPFASGGAVSRAVSILQRAFLLRICTDSYYANRTRPCLLYQIKRCAGPCTGEISLEAYAQLVAQARAFLSGRSRALRERLAQEMNAAAQALDFEQAARLRDRIAAMSVIQGEQHINPRATPEADVFAIYEEAGLFCIEAVFFRVYQHWGNRAFFPRADRSLEPEQVLDAFLGQFYVERPAPRLVLLSHDVPSCALLTDILSARAGHRMAIGKPKRGEKKDLVDNALRNAQETLTRKLSETSTQQKLLAALAQAFHLENVPHRIEVYDNSHIMGTNAIGAMIVAGQEGFVKSQYRTFNMKTQDLTPGDDYAMMRVMLQRRFSRLKHNEDHQPDLVLIDGGRGQFAIACDVLRSLDLGHIPIVAIAKGEDRDAGRETFFLQGREPFKLPQRDAALFFVQRLRDEAHRFAIGTHRARRKADLTRSPLDEIAGIGAARKRALLQMFGSAKAVAQAGLADLEKTPGLNAATAKRVYDHFHDTR